MIHAVGNRCFVDFDQWGLALSRSEIAALLQQKGFETCSVNMVDEARARVGKSHFRLGASMAEAPHSFDCSSFTKWVYAQKGVWIPRLAIQQYDFGLKVEKEELLSGDLVFTSGYSPKSWPVGHVSLFSGRSVITAMIQGRHRGVFEMPLETLLAKRNLCGFRRILSPSGSAATFIIPAGYEIETSDDIKYLVLSLST